MKRNFEARRLCPFFILMMAAAILLNGCTYLCNRGNDALDLFDLGVTINDSVKPGFEAYVDPFSILPVGYSNVDSQFYGLSHRKIGKMDYTCHSLGAVLVGRERRGIGEFNPANPYHARPDQKDLTDWPTFDNGVVGLFAGQEPPPWRHWFEFNRAVHLGWVGIDFSCRISEMVDFLMGWTTIDLMGDDSAESGAEIAPSSQP